MCRFMCAFKRSRMKFVKYCFFHRFMDLQKEQLQVEKAKAEAAKAKVDLALDYDDDDFVPLKADGDKRSRRKRSVLSKYLKNKKLPSYIIPPQSKTQPSKSKEASKDDDGMAMKLLRLLLSKEKPSSSSSDDLLKSALGGIIHKEPLKSPPAKSDVKANDSLKKAKKPYGGYRKKWGPKKIQVVAPSAEFSLHKKKPVLVEQPKKFEEIHLVTAEATQEPPLIYRLPPPNLREVVMSPAGVDRMMVTEEGTKPASIQIEDAPSQVPPPTMPMTPGPKYSTVPVMPEPSVPPSMPVMPVKAPVPKSNQARQSYPALGGRSFKRQSWPGMSMGK